MRELTQRNWVFPVATQIRLARERGSGAAAVEATVAEQQGSVDYLEKKAAEYANNLGKVELSLQDAGMREELSHEQLQALAAEVDAGGNFYVQVFAGRDLQAAEGLIAKLKSQGHRARLFREAEGQGALYKVRVGGYPTRDEARQASQQLVGEGYSGAWVTAVE